MLAHLYTKELKPRYPEEGIQSRALKQADQHLRTYQQMQLSFQKDRLSQLCIHRMSKWVTSPMNKERTKQHQCDTGHLLNIRDMFIENYIHHQPCCLLLLTNVV